MNKSFIKVLGLLLVVALVASVLPTYQVRANATTAEAALEAGADRLVALQNNDGGWDWELDDGNPDAGSALNTVGVIGVGLAEAMHHTMDPAHIKAVFDTWPLLSAKVKFNSQDFELAEAIDLTMTNNNLPHYVLINFYDKLAAGTYVRDGVTYNTQSYVQFIRNGRSGQGANLAAWDLGLQLVSAVKAGVTGTELQYWIYGVEAEINELDDYLIDGDTSPSSVTWWLTEGLAGALYGLATAGVTDFTATAGYYAGKTLSQLFDGLLALQNGSGGFVWHPAYTLPNDQNEGTQATAYAVLALDAYNRTAYLSQIQAAAEYLISIQLSTGGWDNYPAVGSYPATGENNEVTAEAMWAISTAYPTPAQVLQKQLDRSTDTVIDVAEGTYAKVGSFRIKNPGLTLNLADGVVIANYGACFDIYASHTRILGDSYAGAKCISSQGGIAIGVNFMPARSEVEIEDIVIDKLEIAGSENFAFWIGTVKHMQVLNNYVHNVVGVMWNQSPYAETFDIQGNMFKLFEDGIYNDDLDVLDARYNSWAEFNTDSLPIAGEGYGYGVDHIPYTHAELFVEQVADTDPWLNRVISDGTDTITYAVKADFMEIVGAEFDLLIPAGLEVVGTPVVNTDLFVSEGLIPVAGGYRYYGAQFSTDPSAPVAPPVEGQGLTLFSVTLKTSTPGSYALTIDETTDVFTMRPMVQPDPELPAVPGGPSTWVYLDEAHPANLEAIVLPTVTSTFDDSYYLVGEGRDFTITFTNTDTVYSAPELQMTIPAGLTLTYGGASYTGSLTVDLGELVVDEEVPLTFTATFSTPFNATAAVLGVKLVDALTTPETLVDTSFSAFAYTKAIVSISPEAYYIVGEEGNFSVTVTNPLTGKYYNDTAVFDVVIDGHQKSDITDISCTYTPPIGDPVVYELYDNLIDVDTNSDGTVDYVTARIGGLNDYFIIPIGLSGSIPCKITYAVPGSFISHSEMVDVIAAGNERVVSDNVAATAQVYTKPTITWPTLDPIYAGVPEAINLTVTNPSGIPGPFEMVFDLPDGTVISFGTQTVTCALGVCPPIEVTLPDVSNTLSFTFTFDEAWTGLLAVKLFDSDWSPTERELATASTSSVSVDGDFVVTGTFSYQGQTSRKGIQVTFTWFDAIFNVVKTTIEQITGNLTATLKYGGVYKITTNQLRYLDVTDELNKTITLPLGRAIHALELKAGDANDDNMIDSGDAGIVGGQYASQAPTNGDLNFDNKVNVQDLALIGSNYGLTSATAYGTWVP